MARGAKIRRRSGVTRYWLNMAKRVRNDKAASADLLGQAAEARLNYARRNSLWCGICGKMGHNEHSSLTCEVWYY